MGGGAGDQQDIWVIIVTRKLRRSNVYKWEVSSSKVENKGREGERIDIEQRYGDGYT